MAVQLGEKIKKLLQDKETIKVLVTTDENGTPHAVIKQTLHLNEDGHLAYLELLESSQTNKNLVRGIWFNRKVAIVLKGTDGQSYQIIGKPIKAVIEGREFQKHYAGIRNELGDVDLAAVWLIEPERVRNETFSVRKAQEEARDPFVKHLDRLANRLLWPSWIRWFSGSESHSITF